MLIPVQIAGFVINIVLAVILGMVAVKQGAGTGKGVEVEINAKEAKDAAALQKSTPYLVFNLILTVIVIAVLSMGLTSSYVVFL